jgi:hypothetical protein
MFLNSLDEKPIFTRPDGVEIKDITASMFSMKTDNYIKYSIYKVPKEYEMRPDLIAGAVYNNSLFAEVILKYNGISNPFSIQEGDMILIPSLDSMAAIMAKPEGTDVDGAKAIRNSYKYIDPTKIPRTDDNFQNRQIISAAPVNALPPNLAQPGEQQITYRNGRVYFGAGVDTCLQNGMTQSEFLTTVIKSKTT